MASRQLSEMPSKPAVYALMGGRGRSKNVAYIGIADNLKQRITQHIIRRDSSITTGASVVVINPDKISEVWWWITPIFNDRGSLEAAEEVASQILKPILRSQGKLTDRARTHLASPSFFNEMKTLFSGQPTGTIALVNHDNIIERVEVLEEEVKRLKELIQN